MSQSNENAILYIRFFDLCNREVISMKKWFQNLKIGMKISLVVSLILIVGLTTIMMVTINNVRSTTQQDAQNRLGELANARASYVVQFIDQFREYYKGISTMPVVVDALSNPEDPEKVALAQTAVDNYIATRTDMEGIFVATPELYIICHSIREAVGTSISDDPEQIQGRRDGVEAAENNVWFRGATQSSSTGLTVGNIYSGVYDARGNFIGFTGGGCFLQNLTEDVYAMDLNGYEDAQVYVISTSNMNYVMSPDEEEIGAPITGDDEEVVAVATANGKGVMEYKDVETGAISILAYEAIPQYNMILYVCDTEDEIYADVNQLSLMIMILCIAVLIVSLIVVIVTTRIISGEIEHITGVIKEVGTLDLTKSSRLEKYRGRRDRTDRHGYRHADGCGEGCRRKPDGKGRRFDKFLRQHAGFYDEDRFFHGAYQRRGYRAGQYRDIHGREHHGYLHADAGCGNRYGTEHAKYANPVRGQHPDPFYGG